MTHFIPCQNSNRRCSSLDSIDSQALPYTTATTSNLSKMKCKIRVQFTQSRGPRPWIIYRLVHETTIQYYKPKVKYGRDLLTNTFLPLMLQTFLKERTYRKAIKVLTNNSNRKNMVKLAGQPRLFLDLAVHTAHAHRSVQSRFQAALLVEAAL